MSRSLHQTPTSLRRPRVLVDGLGLVGLGWATLSSAVLSDANTAVHTALLSAQPSSAAIGGAALVSSSHRKHSHRLHSPRQHSHRNPSHCNHSSRVRHPWTLRVDVHHRPRRCSRVAEPGLAVPCARLRPCPTRSPPERTSRTPIVPWRRRARPPRAPRRTRRCRPRAARPCRRAPPRAATCRPRPIWTSDLPSNKRGFPTSKKISTTSGLGVHCWGSTYPASPPDLHHSSALAHASHPSASAAWYWHLHRPVSTC